MRRRFLRSIAAGTLVGAVALGWAIHLHAQSGPAAAKPTGAGRYVQPKTPDGHPDLQGVWDFRTITPLERPQSLGNKQELTDQEAAAFEAAENARLDRDRMDLAKEAGVYPKGGVVPYNEFWYDRGNKLVGPKRTSLIIDPVDGRLPPRTPLGEKRQAARREDGRLNQAGTPRADSYTDRPLQERCIIGFNAGPPMTPGAYNNNVQIFQTKTHVAILNEMVHDVRVVPLADKPSMSVPQGMGVSYARFDGNTLVVTTKHFARETSLDGTSDKTELVERFTRLAADTLMYEFTVTDLSEWTRPWTAQLFMVKSPDKVYEYACHEGNYGLSGVLAGARLAEAAAQAKK
jgi:hypothetical protein